MPEGLARLLAAVTSSLVEETKLVGSFRSPGLKAPRPDRPTGVPAPDAATPPLHPRKDARVGPVVASPHGVEAQTCALVREGSTWGRSYNR
ncbi:DUF5926 family protein, partial [Streptomyces sp. WM4235]|uniref:DUF5926 family protein n=1 Tax=Streptomyces sp. WM4235 TaxID=1415551 RepID=UPI003B6346A1